MSSLLHIPKMMNAVVTLQLMAKYSTFLFSLFFSTPLLLLFFSIVQLPFLAFICAHSSVLPFLAFICVHSCTFPFPTFICAHFFALLFSLLFIIVFQLHSMHPYYYNSKTSKMHTTSNNKPKLLSTITLFFLFFEHLTCHIHFSFVHHLLIDA